VSGISPHREVMDDRVNGFLFQHTNFSHLVLKMKGLLEDGEKLELIGMKAREIRLVVIWLGEIWWVFEALG
jgi:hypothetical protein